MKVFSFEMVRLAIGLLHEAGSQNMECSQLKPPKHCAIINEIQCTSVTIENSSFLTG